MLKALIGQDIFHAYSIFLYQVGMDACNRKGFPHLHTYSRKPYGLRIGKDGGSPLLNLKKKYVRYEEVWKRVATTGFHTSS